MPGSIWEANPLLTKSGMGAERYTFDTNILFYAIEYSTDRKHALARRLVGLANPKQVPVLLQTLGELCNSFTKRRRDLLPQAEEFVLSATELFEIVAADSADLLEACMHTSTTDCRTGMPYFGPQPADSGAVCSLPRICKTEELWAELLFAIHSR